MTKNRGHISIKPVKKCSDKNMPEKMLVKPAEPQLKQQPAGHDKKTRVIKS